MDAKSVFEILIRQNTEMLLAYLRAGVRDVHAVDDLYQETVLTAWKRLDDFDRDKPIGPWLRGIAGNMMLAYYRTTARAAVSLDEQALEWLNCRFDAISELEGDTFHQKLAALRECIESLPETYRRPILMRYSEQKSFNEIQSALQLALETLKKRFTRARARLAECLERKLSLTGTTP